MDTKVVQTCEGCQCSRKLAAPHRVTKMEEKPWAKVETNIDGPFAVAPVTTIWHLSGCLLIVVPRSLADFQYYHHSNH